MYLGDSPVRWGISPLFEGTGSLHPVANPWVEEWEVYSHPPISCLLTWDWKAWPTRPMVDGCRRLLPGQGFASSQCRISLFLACWVFTRFHQSGGGGRWKGRLVPPVVVDRGGNSPLVLFSTTSRCACPTNWRIFGAGSSLNGARPSNTYSASGGGTIRVDTIEISGSLWLEGVNIPSHWLGTSKCIRLTPDMGVDCCEAFSSHSRCQ